MDLREAFKAYTSCTGAVGQLLVMAKVNTRERILHGRVEGLEKRLTSSKVLWVPSLISLHNRSPPLPIDIITRNRRFSRVGNLNSPFRSHDNT